MAKIIILWVFLFSFLNWVNLKIYLNHFWQIYSELFSRESLIFSFVIYYLHIIDDASFCFSTSFELILQMVHILLTITFISISSITISYSVLVFSTKSIGLSIQLLDNFQITHYVDFCLQYDEMNSFLPFDKLKTDWDVLS